MANIASLLVNIGVKLDGALAVESKLKKVRKNARELGLDGKVAATRFGRAFQKMGRTVRVAANRARTSISKLVKKMGGLRGIATAGAVALTGAAAGIYKLVDSQTAALSAVSDMSTALGMSIEELQRLRFIATQTGVATSTLERAMRNVNRNMLDVASGGGKAVKENLKTLGLTIRDLNHLSRTQQLGLIGERLKGIGSEARRSAISAKLFGEVAGPEMQSLLAEGREGLERLGASAKNVFSQRDADRASAFQERMGEVKDQVAALVTGIALDLLPIVQDLILDMQAWLAENEGLIAQKIPEVIEQIIDAGRSLVEVLDAIDGAMKSVGINAGTVEVAMGAVAIAAAGALGPITALATAAALLGTAFGRAARSKLVLAAALEGGTAEEVQNAMTRASREKYLQREGTRLEQDATVTPGAAGYGVRVGGAGGLPGRGRGGGGGGGGAGGKSKSGSGSGWLSKALAEGSELGQDALFRLQTGLPRRGGASVDEVIDVLLSGRGQGSPLFENLQRMAARTPATKDVKPTVAMDITINQQFDNQQHIVAPDPESAASKSAEAIRAVLRQETAKAGQAIAGNVVR